MQTDNIRWGKVSRLIITNIALFRFNKLTEWLTLTSTSFLSHCGTSQERQKETTSPFIFCPFISLRYVNLLSVVTVNYDIKLHDSWKRCKTSLRCIHTMCNQTTSRKVAISITSRIWRQCERIFQVNQAAIQNWAIYSTLHVYQD